MKSLRKLNALAGAVVPALLALPVAAADLTPQQIDDSVLSAMDKSADPCQDFYQYACGGWLAKTKLPSDQTRWARSFSVIAEDNRAFLRDMLEDAAKSPGGDPDRQRVGNFYGACMDEAAVEKAGLAPLRPLLAKIDALASADQAFAFAGALSPEGVDVFFDGGVEPDFKNPEIYILHLSQGGLGMPDRDYYVSAEPKKKELLAAYEAHVATVLGLIGEPADAAKSHAAAIVAFETALAKASRERAAMRDIETLYHKVDRRGLPGVARLDWDGYFRAAGYPDLQLVNVATPEFFPALAEQLAKTPLDTVKEYLRWHVVRDHANELPRAFVDARFEFYGKKVAGQAEIAPRWKRCVDATQYALGEAVGKVYVDAKFPGDSKKVALEMIGDIESAFEAGLPKLAWMDAETRARAVEKKAAVANQIGYPDKWRDYSAMTIGRDSFFANSAAAARFEFKRQFDKVGRPIDRAEWPWPPQTVNASYNPLQNRINFPAGILQPPFFHRAFPAALNYGAIGTVIGHELTHGFDDEGRKFDPKGVQHEWWSKEAAEKFDTAAKCVEDQYSRFTIDSGEHVNGKLTLGENIADNGGLKESWVAFKDWQKRHGNDGGTVPGLTADQLFFVAHGQVWCSLITPEQARLRVTTDPHSPARARVYGPIANHPAFGEVFQCKPGTPMNPVDKCNVW